MIPIGRCRSTATSRTQALRTNPTQPFAAAMPAMRSPTSADPQRAAPVDDEHPAVARPLDLPAQEHVVLVAADGARSGRVNAVDPAELPQLRAAQTSASGCSSERSAVEVTGVRLRSSGRSGHQRTVSSRCAGCGVVPAKTTLNVYVPAGSGS